MAKPHLLPELPPMPVMEYKEEATAEESKPDAQAIPEQKEKSEKTPGSPPESKKLKIESKSIKPAASKAEKEEDKKKQLESKSVSPLKASSETTATKPSQPTAASPKTKAPSPPPAKESVYLLEGRDEQEGKGGLIVRKKKTKALEKPKVSITL